MKQQIFNDIAELAGFTPEQLDLFYKHNRTENIEERKITLLKLKQNS